MKSTARKVNYNYLGIVALSVIVISHFIWMSGLYSSSLSYYKQTTISSLRKAADMELQIRINSEDYSKPARDTTSWSNITITMEDTTFVVWANKQDPATDLKIIQYGFKNYNDLNPIKLDSLFKLCMNQNSLEVMESFINYFDLKNDTLISSSALEQNVNGFNMVTPMDTLDIINTIGIKAYVKAPPQVILKPVMSQIAVGIVLSCIALIGVFLFLIEIKKQDKPGNNITECKNI